VPVDGQWSEETLRELTYWTVRALASWAIGATEVQDQIPVQQALLTEFAVRYAYGDASGPVLRRVVERHGEAALWEALDSLRHARSLRVFLDAWLSLGPLSEKRDYFETLLNIEHEALLQGYRETFALVQGGSAAVQRDYFEYTWVTDLPPVTIRAEAVDLVSYRARVTVSDPSGDRPQAKHTMTFYRLTDTDWKHVGPPYVLAAMVQAMLVPTATPSPSP
jgi:hypothetical protein